MRKGPQENGENPSLDKTGKTSNTENIIEDACELRFDELKLVIKMTIRSKTHKDNQTRTKKHDARMQWFELSTNDTIKLPT